MNCQSAFCTPSSINPAINRIGADAGTFRPLCNGQCLTAIGYEMTVPLIALLLEGCSPSAVFRIIAQAVVSPIQGVFIRGWLTHIFEKSIKTMLPLLANSDAAASIVGIIMMGRVRAARNKTVPNSIYACIGLAMPKGSFAGYFPTQAATRLRGAIFEPSPAHDSFIAAVAPTSPFKSASRFPSGKRNYNQPTIALARKVFCLFCGWCQGVARSIIGVHENLHFSCHAEGRLQRRLGALYWSITGVIVPQEGRL